MDTRYRKKLMEEILEESEGLCYEIEGRMKRNSPIFPSDVKALCETLHYIRTVMIGDVQLLEEQSPRVPFRPPSSLRMLARNAWTKALYYQDEVQNNPQLRFAVPLHRESAPGTHIR